MRLAGRSDSAEDFRMVSKPGFTLMETLLALGLTGMLVTAIGVSLDLYWRHRSKCQARVVSSHLLRGIAEDLISELRHIVPDTSSAFSAVNAIPNPRHKMTENSPGTEPPQPLEHVLDVREKFLQLAFSDEYVPVSLVGRSNLIAIYQKSTNTRFHPEYRSQMAASTHRNGLHVVWWCDPGALDSTLSVSWPPRSLTSTGRSVSKGIQGLMRIEIPFEIVQGDHGSSSAAPGSERVICPGIQSIHFRYFDGREWRSEWDSSRVHALPAAVEFQFWLCGAPIPELPVVVDLPQSRSKAR